MGEHNRFHSLDGRAKGFGTRQIANGQVKATGKDAGGAGLAAHERRDGVAAVRWSRQAAVEAGTRLGST